jgi:hypothetical protein
MLEPAPLKMAGEICCRSKEAGGGDVLPNYWNPQRGDPEIILPSSGLEARPTAGLGAWGAWTTVQAATAQDLVLLAAHMSKITTASGSLWVQIGVDPAGGTSFTVREEFAFHCFISGEGSVPIHSNTFRLEPYLIPAGSCVGMRGWVTVGDLRFQGYLALIGTAASWVDTWPNTYIAGGRAIKQRRDPLVGSWVSLPASTAWTQVVASAPNDMLLTALEVRPGSGGTQGLSLEVGVGAPGSEVVFSRIGIPTARIVNFPAGHQEFGRKALILSGERVAVRKVIATGTQDIALYFGDL